jgi:hypothetical protein
MTFKWKLTGALVAMGALAAVVTAVGYSVSPALTDFTNVTSAQPRTPGIAPPNALSPELVDSLVAQGSMALDGGTAANPYYGYDANGTMLPAFGTNVEATKTEPDKNTYLVFPNGLPGADPSYDYGTHFLFQGHELGSPGLLTRINLDADPAHRVTLLASKDANQNNLATIDGSTWDPWSQTLILTTESTNAPTYSATPSYPSTVTDVSGSLGRGGYEGVQNDSAGNLWIVEDIGGSAPAGTNAKRPNSFVYRFVPNTPSDLTTGKLQVLQVLAADGHAITATSQASVGAADLVALNTYGSSFSTRWVTVHNTATDGTAPFNANTAAKAANGTPFKRPENGVFRPDGKFKEFYFTATGDTNATSTENGAAGGWGGLFKLTQKTPTADTGTLSIFYKGNQAHTGLDNITFFSKDRLAAVEDAGATLHGQRNGLDSAWMFDVTEDYSSPANQPVRFIAEGRDASATIDAGLVGSSGFQNEDDNEITGIHVSDGDIGVDGILGAKAPKLFANDGAWRAFWTQQHGDNFTWELLRAPRP